MVQVDCVSAGMQHCKHLRISIYIIKLLFMKILRKISLFPNWWMVKAHMSKFHVAFFSTADHKHSFLCIIDASFLCTSCKKSGNKENWNIRFSLQKRYMKIVPNFGKLCLFCGEKYCTVEQIILSRDFGRYIPAYGFMKTT